jgi:hypothetical protein
MVFKNVIIEAGWQAGASPRRTGRCTRLNWATGRLLQSTFTRTCNGPWLTGRPGVPFTMSMAAQGDVANDGDGQKFLGDDWIYRTWHW